MLQEGNCQYYNLKINLYFTRHRSNKRVLSSVRLRVLLKKFNIHLFTTKILTLLSRWIRYYTFYESRKNIIFFRLFYYYLFNIIFYTFSCMPIQQLGIDLLVFYPGGGSGDFFSDYHILYMNYDILSNIL